MTIGYALPVITREFGVSSEAASWAITSGLIGYILGSFLDSRIGDRFGRRLSLYLSVGGTVYLTTYNMSKITNKHIICQKTQKYRKKYNILNNLINYS